LRIILDEGVPKEVARSSARHHVPTVPDAGWASVKNGKLLALIESAGFDAFITCDKNMEFQQPLHRRPFAVLLLSTNHWDTLERHVIAITKALDEAKPGVVTEVDCGKFVPRTFRKRSDLGG
jgi:hypothetical protein